MRKRCGSPILFLIALLLTAFLLGEWSDARAADSVPADTTLYGARVSPYLLPGPETDTVILRWVAPADEPVSVHYGPKGANGAPPAAERQILEVQPVRAEFSRYYSATWYYTAELTVPRSGYVYGLAEPGNEPDHWHDIAGEPDGTLSVFFTSDSHISNEKEAGRIQTVLDSLGTTDAPELICHTGDVNENSRFGPDILIRGADSFRSVPVAAVCGNHDSLEPFYEYFAMPGLDTSRPDKRFTSQLMDYRFVKEDVLFIGLNMKSGDIASHGDYIRQAKEAHPDCRWTVVMIHYSFFSNGSHGRDATLKHFQDQLAPVFAETDVDLVISGHDHEYDRSLLYTGSDPREGTDGETVEKQPGETMYLSVPTATGTKFYQKITEINAPPAAEGLKFETGYVLARFSPDAIVIRACTTAGDAVDTVTLTCPKA